MYRALKKIVFSWIIIIILVALFGKISICAEGAGQSSASFLKIGLGARPAGMGEAFSAVAEGAISAYWNPAGLAEQDHHEVVLSHFSWYQDLKLEHGAFAYNLDHDKTLAFSMTYLSYGTIEGYNLAGEYTGDLQAYDMATGISFGYRAREDLSLGITAKLINQKLDRFSSTAFAFDLGMKYHWRQYTASLVGTNFGTSQKFNSVSEKLPAAIKTGLAVRAFDNQFLSSLEYEYRLEGNPVLRYGMEFGYQNQYFLRTGYRYFMNQENEAGNGLTFGAGFRYNKAQLDYAYSIKDPVSGDSIHRFSLNIFIDN